MEKCVNAYIYIQLQRNTTVNLTKSCIIDASSMYLPDHFDGNLLFVFNLYSYASYRNSVKRMS